MVKYISELSNIFFNWGHENAFNNIFFFFEILVLALRRILNEFGMYFPLKRIKFSIKNKKNMSSEIKRIF